jgi:hypothetical protein
MANLGDRLARGRPNGTRPLSSCFRGLQHVGAVDEDADRAELVGDSVDQARPATPCRYDPANRLRDTPPAHRV